MEKATLLLQAHGFCIARDAACDFDSTVRACLELFCTGRLPSEAWLQASFSTTANVAWVCGTRLDTQRPPTLPPCVPLLQRCLALDPSYLPAWPLNDITVTLCNEHVLAADRLRKRPNDSPEFNKTLGKALLLTTLGQSLRFTHATR